MAMSLLLRVDLPIPGSAASECPVDPSLYRIYDNTVEALLPVALVCAVSLPGMVAWLLAVGVHLRPDAGRRA